MKNRKNLIRKKAAKQVIAKVRDVVESKKNFDDTLHKTILNYSKLASEKALLKEGLNVDYQALEDLASDTIIHALKYKDTIKTYFDKYFNNSTLQDRDIKIKYGLTLEKSMTRAFFYFINNKHTRIKIVRNYFKLVDKGITSRPNKGIELAETITLDSIDYRLTIDIEAKAVKSTIELFESLNNTEKNDLINYFKVMNLEKSDFKRPKDYYNKRSNAFERVKQISLLKNIDQDVFIQTLENFQSLACIWNVIA